MDLCTDTFADLSGRLGFTCADAGGLVEFRSPLGLANWTLPVLEATIVLGAVLTLGYAIIRLRRHGDPTNLVLWLGATAYLFVIEPPLYFPGAFGIADHVDTMFAHNLFGVEFLWGRLPLYIVAIYPTMATIAYEIVRMLGVFGRYGTVIGAICVGFVHHLFYEIFDHLGPQLRWWEWATDNPLNQPMFTSVPMGSVVVFATLWPVSLAFCVRWSVGKPTDEGRRFTAGELGYRTVAVGLLASLGTFLLPLPATVIGLAGDTARGLVYAAELAVIVVIGVLVLARQWVRIRREPADPHRYTDNPVRWYAAGYLLVFAVLWITALPDYLGAVDGVTETGDPIGSLWYAALCFVAATACVLAVFTIPSGRRPASVSDRRGDRHVQGQST
ncbi:hypothetical protein [Skermania piniformis]|uniref:Uncharacterized protein n=1 Tax=Skermania pinensis TaxID=39122 RepID=A0ABX8S641_9ACTN|nr:hypothetical protein [Skermania piniformis]QXQ13314.1 hypothetical protein KV203_15795 [Skermania piniformis]